MLGRSLLRTIAPLLLTITAHVQVCNAQNLTIHTNGLFAGLSAYPTENISLVVYFGRGQQNGAMTSYVYYELASYDPASNVLSDFSGYGNIPNAALDIRNTSASLTIDTSSVSDFVNMVCIWNETTGDYTCNPAKGGVIAASVKGGHGQYRSHNEGSWSYSYPGVKYNSVGTSDSISAVGNLNVFGVTGLNGVGEIGSNHNTTINMQKTTTP